MNRRYFGTDGIRGRVGDYPITPDFVIKLGWAVGHYFAGQQTRGHPTVIIGKDTRISGYMFESALQAGLVASGVNVILLGPMPTPAIAYLTRTFHAACGIVISASHNPYHDNGIKFFCQNGAKLDDEVELAIESYLDMPFRTVDSDQLGKVSRMTDAAGRYIEYCKSTVSNDFDLQGMKLVLDCAHGATYHIAADVMTELGAEVVTIGTSPDGLNINAGVGSTAPQQLQERVVEEKADLGIAFDGDGDRVFFVDHTGKLVDGDDLLYLIASQHTPDEPGYAGVVGTQMTNMGVELAIRELGMDLVRARVGDRYVKSLMQEKGWMLGGESSGHIICANVTTTGDGIVSALQALQALKKAGGCLQKALAPVTHFPQLMINVNVADREGIASHPAVVDAVHAAEARLDGKGRILLRPSGTEPVIRVMVEAGDKDLVNSLADELAEVVRQAGTAA